MTSPPTRKHAHQLPCHFLVNSTANGSNRLGPESVDGMAAALAKSPTLRELHLTGNPLGDLGVAALVKGAVTGQRLRGSGDYGGQSEVRRAI